MLRIFFGSAEEDEQFKTLLDKIVEYLIFSGFQESSQLLGNMEYDKEDNLFNLFIDKKYPKTLFKKSFII